MAGLRRSARVAAQQNSSPPSSQDKSSPKATPAKRMGEAGTSPLAKRGKTTDEPEQKTIEETLSKDPQAEIGHSEEKVDSQKPAANGDIHRTGEPDQKMPEGPELGAVHEPKDEVEPKERQYDVQATQHSSQQKQDEEVPPTPSQQQPNMETQPAPIQQQQHHTEEPPAPVQQHQSAVEQEGREGEPPSSILEKGLFYFLFRGRVGTDHPKEVSDIARSYIILRPLPLEAKVGEGPIGDEDNLRLLALPKKVLPRSSKDRFLTFVEKTKTSLKDLKDNVLSSSDYETQTVGVRHTPAATPVAEGVYAITSTGRESHLAYITTLPFQLGDVQKAVGIRERGSFIVSAKNPQYPSPAQAQLPKNPYYPREILEEFRSLRWMPLQPKLLDFVNTQILLIGEPHGIENALETQDEDAKQHRETPHEEMEKLEGEDEIRVKHLKGDDAVFADLDLSSKEFSKIPSTW